MQLSNPSVLSVHLKRLSYSEFQVKTDYYCLEKTSKNYFELNFSALIKHTTKITMNIYIKKVAIYYHHQNSEASYDYRSKKMKQKKSMKQQQKKMIP